jgi:hypothetical protein
MVIQIGVHPAGEEPDQHIIRVTPGSSRTITVCKSLLSQTWAPAPGVKFWPQGLPDPTVIMAGSFSLQQITLKQGGTV